MTLIYSCAFSYVVNGKYNLLMSLDDSVDILVEAFNFQGGQYKKIAERKLEKLCKVLYQETIRKSYEDAKKYAHVKIPFGTCPYPAGRNGFTNLMMYDDGSLLPPYMPGGEKWLFTLKFAIKEEGDWVASIYM